MVVDTVPTIPRPLGARPFPKAQWLSDRIWDVRSDCHWAINNEYEAPHYSSDGDNCVSLAFVFKLTLHFNVQTL